MNAWMGEWGKDFRQQRLMIIVWLAIELMFFVATYSLADRFKGVQEVMLILFLLLIIAFHGLFCAAFLFDSLHKEKKRLGLWLHNPQSGYSLLSTKVTQTIGFLIVSLAISYVGFVFPFHDMLLHFDVDIPRTDFARYGIVLFTQLGAASILLGIFVMFFWVLYQVMVSRIGKWAITVNIVLFFGFSVVTEWLEKSALFSWLTEWGGIKIWPSSFNAAVDEEHVQIDIESMDVMLYIGDYVFWLVILLILFLLSGWLIDKKVEV